MTEETAESYYQRFSLDVAARDWTGFNRRHDELKRLTKRVLGRSRNLRILDIGCGGGVLAGFLTRYGKVTGIDFSAPAIDLARLLVPDAEFAVGDLTRLEGEEVFDLITLYDVLEHVPPDELDDLLASIKRLLADGGRVIASTPHPTSTSLLRERHPELLQVIDEEVWPQDLIPRAARRGLILAEYRRYDITMRPQYQVFLFEDSGECEPLDQPPLGLRIRTLIRASRPVQGMRRARLARRSLSGSERRWARWLLWPRGDHPGPPRAREDTER